MLLTEAEISPEEALNILETYADRPSEIYSDIFNTKPWAMQTEILEAVFQYPEVVVKSCHGTGKSFNAARIALAFLLTRPGSIVITTAPTWRQVKDVLWRELATAHGNAKYAIGGNLTRTGLEFAPDWYAIGLSTTEADKFQGYHSDQILVIADEAAGIEEPIYEGIRAITSNQNAHVLMIGNPTTLEGTFYASFKNPYTKKFTISAFDTPNFQANGITDLAQLLELFTPPENADPLAHMQELGKRLKLPYPALISPSWVYQRYVEWGTDSPMWAARVMGEFPTQAENTLIPLNMIEASMDADYRNEHGWQVADGEAEYGVDVARFGSDTTVIAPRRGGHVDDLVVFSKKSTDETTNILLNTINPTEWYTKLKIDDTGVGGGVTDQLNAARSKNAEYRYSVVPINFGGESENKVKFLNKRAEMYWNLRELIINRKIALPKDDDKLANELASIRYEYTSKQQIKIESKDDIKKRLGKSPDRADALALAFAVGGSSWADIGGHRDEELAQHKNATPITSGLLGKRF